jgi:protein-tyrosine phosphatase
MFFYALQYVGFEIFKRIVNLTKRTGLIHDSNFHIYHINNELSVSSVPCKESFYAISNFDVMIGFLDQNEYRNNDIAWIKDTVIQYYNIPVPDYTSPQKEDYEKLFAFIDKVLLENPKSRFLIHCYAGKGRSNCGAAAYLMYKHKITAENAITLIEQKNPISNMNRWQKASLYNLETYISRI